MEKQNVNNFLAKGLHLGGIYPFKIRGGFRPSKIKPLSHFKHDYPEQNAVKNLKKLMYDPEQKWSSPLHTYLFETIILSCQLSSGREFRKISFKAYLSIYPSDFATLIYWIDLSKHDFKFNDIIELIALARGTVERFNRTGISIKWNNQVLRIDNFVRLCELMENDIQKAVSKKNKMTESSVQFAYPVAYIYEICDCAVAQEVIEKYSQEIAGISNLWMDYETGWLKPGEVERVINTDFHPFKYGVTCTSIGCTVEIHTEMIKNAANNYKMSLQEMHFEERFDLIYQCEVPVMQFYIMRIYDNDISGLQTKIQLKSYVSLINPVYLLKLIHRALKLTRLHSELTSSINQFRNVYLTRKSYIPRAINLLRIVFNTQEIEESIDRKLSSIQFEIDTTYSMLTTIFLTILTIIGTVFASIEAFSTAQALGWIP